MIDTFRDDEAGVWVAAARGELGVATEAGPLDALRIRLAEILPDLLEMDDPVPFASDVQQAA